MSIEEVEQVKKFIKEHKPDLSISRVPKEILDKFKAEAELHFENDYGMLLKRIMDDYFELQEFKKMLFGGKYALMVFDGKYAIIRKGENFDENRS